MLPAALDPALRAHLQRLRAWDEEERRCGRPGVTLPFALVCKYPEVDKRWEWQYLFPAAGLCRDAYTGLPARHHRAPAALEEWGQGDPPLRHKSRHHTRALRRAGRDGASGRCAPAKPFCRQASYTTSAAALARSALAFGAAR